MARRCRKCGVPLEGIMYKLIASTIFGVRPSAKDPGLCNKCEMSQGKAAIEGKEVGKIAHYYGHLSVGIIELSGELKAGDRIYIKGHTSDFKQGVASMQINHENVPGGKSGDLVGIKVSQKVHPGDKVYKI
jgi:putative protease